ncbi:MAG: XdhC family protein [Lewinella sp.]|nr:XdhC family protein [Lewinella sp.]
MKEIRNIIATYDAMDHARNKAALATVVSVQASSYRRIGARMLVQSSGEWVGGISGGCLEGDALKRAQAAIFRDQPSIITYDTMEDDEHQIGVGLGCRGRIEVLFTPIDPADEHNPIEVLRQCVPRREASILLQLVGDEAPASLNGRLYTPATLTDMARDTGLNEEELRTAVGVTLEAGTSQLPTLRTSAGGNRQVLCEWLRPELQLIAVGDNYDVDAFAGIAREMGWILRLIGTPRKLSKVLFDLATSVNHYDEADQLALDDFTAVVLMSHDYERDKQMVRHFLPLQPVYLGMLGPRKRLERMHEELAAEGLNLAGYPRLFSPIGLDIGAESPEEIALSIAAEIVAAYRQRSAGFLKDRTGSIHA